MTDRLINQPDLFISYERVSIVVRAHASRGKGLRFEPDSMPRLNARSLFTQQQMGTQWEHWGDKGGEERNWPPYLTCRWLSISVLSDRHSPYVRKYTGLPCFVDVLVIESIVIELVYLKSILFHRSHTRKSTTTLNQIYGRLFIGGI